MDNGTDRLFGWLFPLVCRMALMGAIVVCGWTVVQAVWKQSTVNAEEQKSTEINWQDLTPTCDGVLCDLGRVHANIGEAVNQCRGGRLSPQDLSRQLVSAKQRLRKVNAAGLDDPDMKSALLQLRQHQIALCTEMRKEIAQFCEANEMGAKADAQGIANLPSTLLVEWCRRLQAFSGDLSAFAAQAGVLPDEIPDKRAAAAVFAQAVSPDERRDQASVSTRPGDQRSSDGQGGK